MTTEENTLDLSGALELKPGGMYVIECEAYLSREALERLQADVAKAGQFLGVRFLVLPCGLKIARETKTVADAGAPV